MASTRPRRGVCASSAASAAAYWHSSALPAGRSRSSESAGGTCPPTASWLPLRSTMAVQQVLMKTWRRKGPGPSGLCDPSLSQVECRRVLFGRRGLVPGRSSRGSVSEGTWSYPWRERSSGIWGCFSCWGESWSLKLWPKTIEKRKEY